MQESAVEQAAVVPPNEQKDARPFRKVALFTGDTGAGKSKIINALLNDSAKKDDLEIPASIGNATTGTTERLSYYYCGDTILTDTIGFFDRKIPVAKVKLEFVNFVLALGIGINKFYFVLKHGKIKESDVKTFTILEYLFGREVYAHSTLLVTHLDERHYTLDAYRELVGHDREYLEFISRFGDRIILGSMATHEMQAIDTVLETGFREPFLKAIKADLDACSNEKRFMHVIDFSSFIKKVFSFLRSVFQPDDHDKKRLKSLFEQERLQLYHEDPICTEIILNDMYITQCGHVFHFDCLQVWLRQSNTCPNCRRPLKEFIHLKKEEEQVPVQGRIKSPKGTPNVS